MSRTEFAVFQEGAEGNGDKRIACWIRTKADADLVVAAPALLAACRRFLDAHQADMDARVVVWGTTEKAGNRCLCGPCVEARAAVKLATDGADESP